MDGSLLPTWWPLIVWVAILLAVAGVPVIDAWRRERREAAMSFDQKVAARRDAFERMAQQLKESEESSAWWRASLDAERHMRVPSAHGPTATYYTVANAAFATQTLTRRIALVALAIAALFLALNSGDIREVGFAWVVATASIFIVGYLGALVVLVVGILLFGWIILGDVSRVVAIADEMNRARADSALPSSVRNGVGPWTAGLIARGIRLAAPLRRRTFEHRCQCGAILSGRATPEDEDAEFSRWWRQGHDGSGHGPWMDSPAGYSALAAERESTSASQTNTRTTATVPSLPTAVEVARILASELTRPLTPEERAEVQRRREARAHDGGPRDERRSRLVFPVLKSGMASAAKHQVLRVSLYGDSRRIPLPPDIEANENDWEDPVGEVVCRVIRPVLADFNRAGRTFRTMTVLEGVVVDADMPSRMPITEVRISAEHEIDQAEWDQLVAAVRAEVDSLTRRTGLAAVVADMTPANRSD